jgi:hypothetical protein
VSAATAAGFTFDIEPGFPRNLSGSAAAPSALASTAIACSNMGCSRPAIAWIRNQRTIAEEFEANGGSAAENHPV